eukprot:scaffold397470_cov28-Prasinocladus_malaysianus.AAC.1
MSIRFVEADSRRLNPPVSSFCDDRADSGGSVHVSGRGTTWRSPGTETCDETTSGTPLSVSDMVSLTTIVADVTEPFAAMSCVTAIAPFSQYAWNGSLTGQGPRTTRIVSTSPSSSVSMMPSVTSPLSLSVRTFTVVSPYFSRMCGKLGAFCLTKMSSIDGGRPMARHIATVTPRPMTTSTNKYKAGRLRPLTTPV